MNSHRLPVALIGAAIVLVQPVVAAALTVDEVSSIAKEITVLIDGINPGSGVVIARESNTYYVLTAEHVVSTEDEYQVVAHDGKQYSLNYNTVKKLPGVDLAVLQFSSDQNYKVATLANYDLPAQDKFVYVSGWPAPNRYIQEQARLFSLGKMIPKDIMPLFRIFPLENGYELIYTCVTYAGMSGGPVFDTNGQVIGIHGQNEGEVVYDEAADEDVRLQIGYSAAVPISTFLKLAPQAGMPLKLSVDSSPPGQLTEEEIISIGSQYVDSWLKSTAPGTDSTNVIDLANLGNQKWRTGDLQGAINAYEKALQLDPNFYQAWYGRGLVLTYWKRFSEAIASYDKTLQLKPDSSARKLRENLLRQLGSAGPAGLIDSTQHQSPTAGPPR